MNALRFITVCVTLGAYVTEVLEERYWSNQGAVMNNANSRKTTYFGMFRKCNSIVQAQKKIYMNQASSKSGFLINLILRRPGLKSQGVHLSSA